MLGCLSLWVTSGYTRLDSTLVALIGIVTLLHMGTITWNDISTNTTAVRCTSGIVIKNKHMHVLTIHIPCIVGHSLLAGRIHHHSSTFVRCRCIDVPWRSYLRHHYRLGIAPCPMLGPGLLFDNLLILFAQCPHSGICLYLFGSWPLFGSQSHDSDGSVGVLWCSWWMHGKGARKKTVSIVQANTFFPSID